MAQTHDAVSPVVAARRVRVWREAEVLLLVALVGGIYFTRPTTLPIHGEEPRWAQVAYEMLASGDYIVPRQQGEPFPDRPPLNSWTIAAASHLLGQWSPLAVRLPTLVATLMITLLVYGYARTFLGRIGALAAGASYASMGQVLELGRLAESDNLLTLGVASSLLVWHVGYERGWPRSLTWTLGYALAAMAALVKGPQGPIYFIGTTCVFLGLVRRDWRYLLCRAHALGLLVFLAILGAWQIPFYRQLDWQSVVEVWTEEGALATRFDYRQITPVLVHWCDYPLRVLASLVPWSLMLACYAFRDFRRSLGECRPQVSFLATALAVAFPTCWLPADSVPHYFMPMYPIVALFVGLAIERSFGSLRQTAWQKAWPRFARFMALVITAMGATFGLASCFPERMPKLAQPTTWAIAYGLAALFAAVMLLRLASSRRPAHARVLILVVAAFFGLTSTGPLMNCQVRASAKTAAEIEALRAQLPAGARLVSFGQLHHRFTYYYRDLVELREMPKSAADVEPDLEYFCVLMHPFSEIQLPFEWEPVATISCDRSTRPDPDNRVLVCRRRLLVATVASSQPGETVQR
jgi:4-amino-4-deoxy-L-arabinose transferase-like glycosyltransferase